MRNTVAWWLVHWTPSCQEVWDLDLARSLCCVWPKHLTLHPCKWVPALCHDEMLGEAINNTFCCFMQRNYQDKLWLDGSLSPRTDFCGPTSPISQQLCLTWLLIMSSLFLFNRETAPFYSCVENFFKSSDATSANFNIIYIVVKKFTWYLQRDILDGFP